MESTVRVLVVDDSMVFRAYVAELLQAMPGVEVVGRASNGALALRRMASLKPDLVTLDVEMPVMDGLETLAELQEHHPHVDVLMISGLSLRAAELTLKAMSMGALDFLAKPSAGDGHGEVSRTLQKVVEGVRERMARRRGVRRVAAPRRAPALTRRIKARGGRVELVAIGVSTGGPKALVEVLSPLPKAFPVPIVLVQHMPPLFTKSLAQTLNAKTALKVKEAEDGEVLQRGTVYVAPGGQHMKVRLYGTQKLAVISDEPPELHCKPSVNILFRSVAQSFRDRALGVILTGMGNDGAQGLRRMKQHGATVIAQDEESCVVYGMPKAAVDEGVVDIISPLSKIAGQLQKLVGALR